MSQYGYIPIVKSHLLTEYYSLATPDTWQFERGGVVFGGLEETVFSEPQKDEIIALGGEWFVDANSFTNWLQEIN